jgi:hypothetical protein
VVTVPNFIFLLTYFVSGSSDLMEVAGGSGHGEIKAVSVMK